ncbi:MAG TPA: C40 family peptidase [Gaiellaceae bacterium]|nr:C40 family peptidase [Gaiellaceae bacterium]
MRGSALRVALCCGLLIVLLGLPAGQAAATPRHASQAGRHARPYVVHLRRARLLTARRNARDRVVMRAWRAVGVRYRWGGASLSGFDCSGLTQWVYRSVGVSLPHLSAAQWRYGRRVSRRALRPGDLIFFTGLGHVGIYLGHGALIHAPHPGAPVRFARLTGWFSSHLYGARRFRVTG